MSNKQQVNVKASIRKNKSGKLVNVKAYSRKQDKKNLINRAKNVGLGFAATLGLSVTTYALFRAKYRAGFTKRAKQAFDRSLEIEKQLKSKVVGDGLDSTQLKLIQRTLKQGKSDKFHFVVGGMDGFGKSSLLITKGTKNDTKLQDLIDDDFIPFLNFKHQTKYKGLPEKKLTEELKKGVLDMYAFFRTGLKQGGHPDAQELAAYIMAVNRMHPEKQIRITGLSGGGVIAAETLELLNNAEKQNLFKPKTMVKSLNIATPYAGITKLSSKQLITVGSKGDLVNNLFPSQNRKQIDDSKGHLVFAMPERGETGYFNSKQFQKIYKDFFND